MIHGIEMIESRVASGLFLKYLSGGGRIISLCGCLEKIEEGGEWRVVWNE